MIPAHGVVAPQTYSLQQYMAVSRAGGSSYSPAADRIAYVTNRSGSWQLWVADRRSGNTKKLTSFAGGVSSEDWCPTSDAILVVADRGGDQKYQFFMIDAATGAQRVLTNNKDIQHDYGGWMADGRSIYYADNSRDSRFFDCYVMDISRGNGVTQSSQSLAVGHPPGSSPFFACKLSSEPTESPAATGEAERILQKDAILHPAACSQDGNLIAVEETHSEVDSDIIVVDRRTHASRVVTAHSGHAKFSAIGFSPDDASIYFRTNQEGEFMAVVAQDLASGKRRAVVAGRHDIDAAVLDPTGTKLAISTNVDGYEVPSVVDLVTGATKGLIGLPSGIAFPQKFSPDGSHLSLSVNTPVHDDDIYDVDLASRKVRRVTDSPQGGIDHSTLVQPTIIRYRAFDGRMIPAILYVPKGASARRKAAVILSIHGGPEEQEQPYLTNYYQFLVSRGYAILAPNVRGSTGYGKAYVDLDNGRLRWNAIKDLEYAVRWIGAQPQLDRGKVVGFGPSYGGFSTLVLLSHTPNLLAGGIDFYGPTDLKTFLNRTAPYRRPNRIAEYGDPVKDSAFMDSISPARHAGQIKKPLLIVQGKSDPIVPYQESEDLVKLLRRRRRYVDYLLLPNEGHGLASQADYVKAFERVLRFLRRLTPGHL